MDSGEIAEYLKVQQKRVIMNKSFWAVVERLKELEERVAFLQMYHEEFVKRVEERIEKLEARPLPSNAEGLIHELTSEDGVKDFLKKVVPKK